MGRQRKKESLLADYSQKVEPLIKKTLTLDVDKNFQKLVSYQIETGGKRIRPALAIISCRALGGKLKDVLASAAALEILHNYTLIVDDIIDNSFLRRGKATTWYKFGSSIAQCLAIDYSASIFQAVNFSKKSSKLIQLLAKTLKTIADGEILDILFEQAGREKEPYIVKNRYLKIKEKDYFKMVTKKTAFLMGVCCQIGGITAGARKKEISALYNYGFNLGIAFQIQDDILDIFGKEEKFGKKIGKDIIERKGGNIVILLALKELDLKRRRELLTILRKKKIKKEEVKRAVSLIKKTKSREKAISLGKKFIEKAKKSLRILPKNRWLKILFQLADFTISREK
jgi:geranylgeranyl diphosphate synthase type I